MDKLQAYNQFWNSFGIPAYDEGTVPDSAKQPYITYSAASDDFNNGLFLTASIWYRGRSWADVTRKEKEISEFIGRGGVNISYDRGAFWITKGTPWAQRMSDPEDDMIRRILLQINVEFFD